MAARTATTATTIISSIKVNPDTASFPESQRLALQDRMLWGRDHRI